MTDGLQREAGPGADPRRRLRAREARRRGRPRTHASGPHARLGRPRESSAGIPRRVLSGCDQRDRDEQSSAPSNSRDEPAALQALRVLRPPARVPALGRLRRRAGVPRAGASRPRDLVRDRPSRHADLCRHRAVLPEPRVPGRGVAAVSAGTRVRSRVRPRLRVVHLVSRQISPRLAVVYWVAQLLGGLGGALALAGVFPASIWQPYHLGTPTLGSTVSGLGWDVGIGTGILVEAILTFLLVFVIFGTGIDPKGSFNAVGGLAIGLTISIDIMMGGPLTGAAMNPARWFGPAVVSGFFDNWYVYWIGPFIGGAFAALLYANVFLEKSR